MTSVRHAGADDRHSRGRDLRWAALAVPAIALAAALAGSASAATTTTPAKASHPAPVTKRLATTAPQQGIIMRDGGVCDPIRHMGC